jgi:calcineurin-like phosphoesterase
MPHHLSVGKGKPVLNAILVEVDAKSGRASGIERVTREIEER